MLKTYYLIKLMLPWKTILTQPKKIAPDPYQLQPVDIIAHSFTSLLTNDNLSLKKVVEH